MQMIERAEPQSVMARGHRVAPVTPATHLLEACRGVPWNDEGSGGKGGMGD